MAFSYTNSKTERTYFLHGRETSLKNGYTRTIYFFAKTIKEGALNELPEGYEVFETSNGLPVLKKSA